jgi:hypothetical protein
MSGRCRAFPGGVVLYGRRRNSSGVARDGASACGKRLLRASTQYVLPSRPRSPSRPANEFCGPVVDPLPRDAPQRSAPCPDTVPLDRVIIEGAASSLVGAHKVIFLQEFLQNRRIAMRWVTDPLRCRPGSSKPACRHREWLSLVALLLFKQVPLKVKIVEFDASAPWRLLCFRSIPVTSDSKRSVKKNRKTQLFGSDRPKQGFRHLHAAADLIRFPPLADRKGPARGMAQSGSASALGAEGRGFESLCPDQFRGVCTGHILYRSVRGHR